jgi:predicted Zn-dependent peptidase
MGIAYNINAYNMSYIYEGAFVIDLGVDNNNVKKAIKAIIKELGKLVRKGVSKEDLEKAKNIKITSLSIGLQSPQHKLNYYGLNELYFNTSEKKEHNKEIDIETRIANYKAITRKQINDVIKDLFKKETMNIFTYGKKLDI